MMNVNNVSGVSAFTQKSAMVKDQNLTLPQKTAQHSSASVVNLQSGIQNAEEKSSIKVDAGNAKSMVADIASMLTRSNGGVQANISAFDAAALLA